MNIHSAVASARLSLTLARLDRPALAFWLFLLLGVMHPGLARADFVLQIGAATILANQDNQLVPVLGFYQPGTNLSADVSALQLNARIDDGNGSVGSSVVFQGADTNDTQQGYVFAGTVWSPSPTIVLGQGPIPGFPQYASVGISLAAANQVITLTTSPQVVAYLVVDTRGAASNQFTITLNDSVLGTSYFTDGNGDSLVSSTNVAAPSNFSVAAVPEPSSILLALSLSTVFFSTRRRAVSNCITRQRIE